MSLRIEIAAVLALAITACQHGNAQEQAAPAATTAPAGDNGGQTGGSTTGAGGTDAGTAGGGVDAGPASTAAATVVSLAISAAPSVPQGAQEELIATALWSDGSSTDVTGQAAWSTSDAAVAPVAASSDGLEWAAGASTGSATISASFASQSATASLSVTAPALTELALTGEDVAIAAGTSIHLGAVGLYTDGSRRDVTAQAAWATSDASVATSAGAGDFGGAAAGTATVSAALAGLTSATTLTVTAATLTAIELSPADASIASGTAQAYAATGIFSDDSTQDLTSLATWTSSQASVAAMSGSVAAGAASGTAVVSASFLGVSGSTTLTVTSAVLTGLEVSPVTPSIAAGTGCAFAASGLFSDGSVQDLTAQAAWASSNASVASVDGSGNASGLSAGSTIVSASFGGFSDSTALEVTAATLSSIAVGEAGGALPRGTDRQLSATAAFSDGSSQDLTAQVLWSSSDPSIATVSSTGLVHAVAPGTAQVYASLLGETGSASLTVSTATLASIAIGPANAQVPVKYWTHLTATGTYSDGSTVALTGQALWTSSNGAVASVGSTNGVATGLAAGTSTVTAWFGGVSGAATLTVMNTRLSTIAIAPAAVSLAAGDSATLVATGTFANGFAMDVTAQVRWSSSNKNVAVAGNAQRGVVRAVAAGAATVTASHSGRSGSAGVTVE